MRPWRRTADGTATCHEVLRILQSYLDGELNDLTAQRVARHLGECRRCGLEAAAYTEVKRALRRRARGSLQDASLSRLREFSRRLATEGDSASPG